MADVISIDRIKELIPHRYPFLLVDRIEVSERGQFCVGIKNVTANEPFFPGHFPEKPVMPGVLILEAMAQTAGALAIDFLGPDAEGKLLYFMGIDGAKFRRMVEPGDQIRMELTRTRGGGAVWRFDGVAKVGDDVAAEAKLTAMLER
ncbi:3-hydroxyacyl-ACP dehydratase FabZ [Yunchengibacter salinarum]|uniref:3-hydroxyacyl-ACP dehydratase FabZ n=1 Tax=Yunchengibacter salinarum TaxID=3133399 RepID=UPI0035B59C6B